METTTELKLVIEGKTKKVFADGDGFCLIESKSAITANDDPSLTQEFKTKAVSATTTTCRVFELLRDAGLPVAYDKQISETCFRAPLCEMMPLECIARRLVAGSFGKRRPDLSEGQRFHRLEIEFFLKTTNAMLRGIDGSEVQLELPLEPNGRRLDDPLIINPRETVWNLAHPKKPSWDAEAKIEQRVGCDEVLPVGLKIDELAKLTRKVFLVLERAWSLLGYRLIDFKIEFGIARDGTLVIADVIDNDSWRLRTSDNKEVSKQLFREGHPLAEVEDKYALVARLVEHFRVPKQAIVVWRGSDKDAKPDLSGMPAGVNIEDIVCSAHKSPLQTAAILEEILAKYPDGGVFVPIVGMSNGLGPILSARTTWPVIGVPVSFKDFPDDAWSSLRLPSNVPMVTVLSPANAIQAALNILSVSNPAVYAERQYIIEQLDN